ncbi:translation initiation factor IF-2-like [Leopardus geoffroyi]|uniref:translation initiation factor IF-2-like n=1 Tax=Leopardus geoffroyi TaxID=46844 RepID=UPI001E260249|nr:translation initiation factor IF-2-like [Leopardus geoffroyi]
MRKTLFTFRGKDPSKTCTPRWPRTSSQKAEAWARTLGAEGARAVQSHTPSEPREVAAPGLYFHSRPCEEVRGQPGALDRPERRASRRGPPARPRPSPPLVTKDSSPSPPRDRCSPARQTLRRQRHVAQKRTDQGRPEPETESLAYGPPTPPFIGPLRRNISAQAQLAGQFGHTSRKRCAAGVADVSGLGVWLSFLQFECGVCRVLPWLTPLFPQQADLTLFAFTARGPFGLARYLFYYTRIGILPRRKVPPITRTNVYNRPLSIMDHHIEPFGF